MWIITHGPLDKLDTTATVGECVDQEHLMDIVPGEAIRRRNQHACKGGHRCPLSESVKIGTLEGGAAVAVIAIDMLVCNMPSRVKGNFPARFWNSGGRGDSPADCSKLSDRFSDFASKRQFCDRAVMPRRGTTRHVNGD